MQNIYQSLTEKDGVLKSLFTEEEMRDLLSNPFHITRTNIRVRHQGMLSMRALEDFHVKHVICKIFYKHLERLDGRTDGRTDG